MQPAIRLDRQPLGTTTPMEMTLAHYDDIRARLVTLLGTMSDNSATAKDLEDDDDLAERLDLSSMDLVGVAVDIEREFSFPFGTEAGDINSLRTFGQLIALVAERATKKK